MRQTARLRELLRDEEFVTAGGCYDALSARVVESVGFSAAYASGFSIEATLPGAPDIGFLTLTEFADHLRYIAAAVQVPVIADGEAGFGSVASITRAIREFEKAGVAGIHIEDQTNPKVCPAVELSREVVSREEAVGRVRAACAARVDPDFVIIARTDADEISVDEVITRCQLYLDAGADLAMPLLKMADGQAVAEMPLKEQRALHTRVCQEVDGPLVWAEIPQGFTIDDIKGVGYKVCLVVSPPLMAAFEGLFSVWKEFLAKGTVEDYFTQRPFPLSAPTGMVVAMLNFLGVQEWLALEKEYVPSDRTAALKTA